MERFAEWVGGTAVGASVASAAGILAVHAAGFGTAGIAAGSYAAGMMSAAAVATGTGGVAAGSAVAVLQSLGTITLLGAAPILAIPLAAGVAVMAVPAVVHYIAH